ncbi:MAG: sigma-70 family RNA polymerase sigma factor [Chloroflexi bacterium]|nr:sigma-70 family RNA polymerase sigma factor [Chloroflexota bacterium]
MIENSSDTLTDSDRELILACRKGNVGAWERVLQKYERLVFSVPLHYGFSREDAADVTQLTFTILMQRLNDLREDSHLGAWLTTVARRHTWRLFRRANREVTTDDDDFVETVSALGKPGNDPIDRWEMTQWVDQGLTQLNERCRMILLALYFDSQEPSYAEIASRLGIPVGSVGPTRARCLERLKQVLQES